MSEQPLAEQARSLLGESLYDDTQTGSYNGLIHEFTVPIVPYGHEKHYAFHDLTLGDLKRVLTLRQSHGVHYNFQLLALTEEELLDHENFDRELLEKCKDCFAERGRETATEWFKIGVLAPIAGLLGHEKNTALKR